MTNIISPSKQH